MPPQMSAYTSAWGTEVRLLTRALLGSVVGLLSACAAQPQDLTSRRPYFEIAVNLAPAKVQEACFANVNWRSGPYRSGLALWMQYSWSHIEQLVNVTPTPTGSQIRAFTGRTGKLTADSDTIEQLKRIRTFPHEEVSEVYRLNEYNIDAVLTKDCLQSLR